MKNITLTVYVAEQHNSSLQERGRSITDPDEPQPDEVFIIQAPDRSTSKPVNITIQDNNKVLEFVFQDDTTWICDSSTLHELFPDIEAANRSIAEPYLVPQTLEQSESERGIASGIALKFLKVYLKKNVPGKVKEIAEKLETKLLITGEGLFRLKPDFTFDKIENIDTDKPVLLFLHGTNSNNSGAFDKLLSSEAWLIIQRKYGNNILAFQHRTLTHSPLQNVVDLAKELPANAKFHLISHSRGGLLGEILCNYSSSDNAPAQGFTTEQIELLKKYKRDADLNNIYELDQIFKNKKISVEKFIRVACPAAGTRLASKRIDMILNVFYNITGRDLNFIGGALKELISETLKTKDNIDILPGLEAMSPTSPFIEVLNNMGDNGLRGTELSVIAGNGKLSGTLDGLYYILGRLFFWQKNDLVVNTDSMYLGAKRSEKIQYFFDQGTEVDHFNYFLNNTSRDAIVLALKTNTGLPIPGFSSVYQYEVPASDRAIKRIEYGELEPYPNLPAGKKPILVLLPGIMGSNLSSSSSYSPDSSPISAAAATSLSSSQPTTGTSYFVASASNGRKYWLDYSSMMSGGLANLEISNTSLIARSVVYSSYGRIAEHFSDEYDVVVYPFDWRQDLNLTAKDLAVKLESLLTFNKPIKVIAHSMGGVLMRDLIITQPATWLKLNSDANFRLLFLGAPLGGSFRILTVLFGTDFIINTLNLIDRKHTKQELINIFRQFPGLLCLLPLTTDPDNDFAKRETWLKMMDANNQGDWPIPSEIDLQTFRNYRDQVLQHIDKIDYSKMNYIAGKGKFTPSGYFNDVIPPRVELVFLGTGDGDESVTWKSGIPDQLINANAVYYADTTHGALADEPDLFEGIGQILKNGSTVLLSKTPPPTMRGGNEFRLPETYNFDYTERGIGNAVFGRGKASIPVANNLPLSISVSNGDLAYTSYPILIGHFENDGILYSEKAVDVLLNGSLSSRHQLELYPGAIGTNSVVLPIKDQNKFPGAVVAGLGEPGTLTSYLLSKTVEQAVLQYLLILNGRDNLPEDIGISALMVGCGYGGLTLDNSIKSIIEGITNANKKIKTVGHDKMKFIRNVEFIEILEDRALACLYTLSKLENKENSIYNFRIVSRNIRKLFGFRKRLPTNISEEWWNRITVKHRYVAVKEKDANGTEIRLPSLVFNSSTRRAREEESELFTNTKLLDQFLDQISTQNRWTSSAAKALFELMIPNEFKDRLKSKANINWVLDERSAAYPWELLQEKSADAKPLCIGGGMIRQLMTNSFREDKQRGATELALIVGDPLLNGFAGQLDGARDEALKVQSLFAQHEFPTITLVNTNYHQVTNAMYGNDFKVMHLASHGVYDPADPSRSGMVVGDSVFLTTSDFRQLGVTPELVFINCCHLGRHVPPGSELATGRFRLAANIGTGLIESGVKAVIAAGWAVNDLAAHDFATVFYNKMFSGYNFGDAVSAARAYLYEKHPHNNTWGAYQCYGDPFYKLVNRTIAQKAVAPDYAIEEEALVDLNNLRNSLDTRSVTSVEALEKLELIMSSANNAGLKSASIAELRSAILLEVGEYQEALFAYNAMFAENAATFSVAALERLCNLRSKSCVAVYRTDGFSQFFINEMKDVFRQLDQLVTFGKTPERLSIIGSSYKRLALMSEAKDKLANYRKSEASYLEAYFLKAQPYSLNNWVVMKVILDLVDPSSSVPERLIKAEQTAVEKLERAYNNTEYREIEDKINQIRKTLSHHRKTLPELIEMISAARVSLRPSFGSMDYWDLIQEIAFDISLIFLGAIPSIPEMWDKIYGSFADIWKRAGSKGKMMSEVENLEILSDMLSLSVSERITDLKEDVDELKLKLELLVR